MYSWAHLTLLDKFHQVGCHGWPSWSLFVAVMVCGGHCWTSFNLPSRCVTFHCNVPLCNYPSSTISRAFQSLACRNPSILADQLQLTCRHVNTSSYSVCQLWSSCQPVGQHSATERFLWLLSCIDRLELCDLLTLTFLLFLPDLSVLLPLELFVYLRLIIGTLFLCMSIRSSDSLATFQSRLKSHLFASTYHV